MKTLLRTLGTLGVAGVVIYLLRDRLLPPPVIEPAPAPIRGTTPKPAAPADPDDLTEIDGIGPVYASRLSEAGIATFAGLAAADPEQLATAAGTRPELTETWIAQATERTG